MKWLVQTLDSLTSNRTDHEATTEQNRLKQLILRYKNLIPTIEITMTKTDIYSKSYTYRKEVRQVCILLQKVREKSQFDASSESLESLSSAVANQETRLNQLEKQRENIVSMLQRGKDLLKDQHAPTFVSAEVQQLEASWNETYGQSMETLKTLKNTQRLWDNYHQQREGITKLIQTTQQEFQRIQTINYRDAAQVSADLLNQQELEASLDKSARELLKQLEETHGNLCSIITPERQECLKCEVSDIENQVKDTLKTVQQKVIHFTEYSSKWSKFQTDLNELQNWTHNIAPQSITGIHSHINSPEERLNRTQILRNEIQEKITILKTLTEESQTLVQGELLLFNNFLWCLICEDVLKPQLYLQICIMFCTCLTVETEL